MGVVPFIGQITGLDVLELFLVFVVADAVFVYLAVKIVEPFNDRNSVPIALGWGILLAALQFALMLTGFHLIAYVGVDAFFVMLLLKFYDLEIGPTIVINFLFVGMQIGLMYL